MRRSALILVAALYVACKSFEAEKTEREAPANEEDAGTTKGKDAAAPAEASTDAAIPLVAPFEDVTYDAFDDFEDRADVPAAGPLDWEEKFTGDHSDAVRAGNCSGAVGCSGTYTALFANGIDYVGFAQTNLHDYTKIVRLDFSMNLETVNVDTQLHLQMASFELDDNRFVFFELDGDALRLGDQFRDDDGPYDNDFTPIGVASSVLNAGWAHYRFYLNLDTGLVALARDGVPFAATRTLRPDILGHHAKWARIGITFADHGLVKLAFDDVGLKQWP